MSPDDQIPLSAHPPLALEHFMKQSGLSATTCWRFRKKGWLKTIVIAGRHYVTRAAIAEFNERAASGEFAGDARVPSGAKNCKPRGSQP